VQSSNGHNGGGSGNDDESPNIIKLPSRKERAKADRVRVKVTLGQPPAGHHEPMINLPPFTKCLLLIIFGIHIPMELFLDPEKQYWVIGHFGFIPAYYTGAIPFAWPALLGPFTFAFLHGGWFHVLINGVMLMAFGAGLERWMGWKRMAILMLLCSLASVAVQLLFNLGSDNPVIGASGAISGMFAAAMIMLQQRHGAASMGFGGRYGLWPFILVWIGISLLFGMTGGPGGENIAWAAHIGGFLAGFVLIKPVLRLKV